MKIPLLLVSALALVLGVTNSIEERSIKVDLKGVMDTKREIATFAGGCFWCIESSFEHLDGVQQVVSGYTGGALNDPTYEQVSSGTTRHIESVQVFYDPEKISYTTLLDHFWHQFDPTDSSGSFGDRGDQYTSAIFYHSGEQKQLAEESKIQLGKSGPFEKPIVTRILKAVPFYNAEEYHQDYYKKNPVRYNLYRSASGRDQFIQKVWEKNRNGGTKMDDQDIFAKQKESLTPLQYKVTQEGGTEPPFQNEYWNNKEEGLYVDIVSGEPLFRSTDKYDSETGWPSFTRPINPDNIVEIKDNGLFMSRIEVQSKKGQSHLGHVFDDGPGPTGLRYCINSASLRFISKEKLEAEGYGDFVEGFE